MPKVLVFEDDEKRFKLLQAGADAAELIRFEPLEDDRETYEHLLREVQSNKYSLLALDLDLSKYTVGVVRRETIRGVASDHYMPLCAYSANSSITAAGSREHAVRPLTLAPGEFGGANQIILDGTKSEKEVGRTISQLATGFESVANIVTEDRVRRGRLLHQILQTPSVAERRVEQYIWGTPAVSAFSGAEADSLKRMVTSVGYWVVNCLLPFPGALLDEVAAAVYLKVGASTFSAGRSHLETAEYQGPFRSLGTYWWRDLLDDLVAEGGHDNGIEFFRGKDLDVERAVCVKCDQVAEFVSFVTGDSLCRTHAVPLRIWLPAGADLVRAEEDEAEHLEFWI